MKKTIDIISSAYNEEECLPELFRRLDLVASKEKNYLFKFILIDNGSNDATWKLILEKHTIDSRFVGVKMSRNFTLDAAFTCGLDQASSDLAVIMASDLQDPPEVIHDLLREYERGYDQVLVKIKSRPDVPFIRRKFSTLFYRLANSLTGGMLPQSVSDFRLMSRRCYESIRSLRESHRFFRGIASWVGFRISQIEIDRAPRFAGESKWLGWSFLKVVLYSTQSILAYSSLPLAWVSIFGILSSLISFITLIFLVILWLVLGVPFAGFGTIVACVFLFFSVTILALGIIAQYVGLIYEEVKNRPLYIVEQMTSNQ